MKEMKNPKFKKIFLIVIILMVYQISGEIINYQISGMEIINVDNIKGSGLIDRVWEIATGQEIHIGEPPRIFTSNGPGSSVKVVQESIFLVNNANVKTAEELIIETKGENYLIFTKGDYSVYKNRGYIQIFEEAGFKKISIPGNELKIKKEDIQKIEKKENIRFELKEGGSIIDKFNAKYENLRKIDSKNPELIFDKDGKLIEAHFKTGKDNSYYIFGNDRIQIPKDAEVHFKNEKVEITTSDGKILPSESIDGKLGTTIFEFKSKSKEFIIPSKGKKYFIKNILGIDSIKMQDGKLFIDQKGRFIFGDQTSNKGYIEVLNEPLENIRTFIDFDGKENLNYKGAYISIDDINGKFATGYNIEKFKLEDKGGPKISFLKDNPFDIAIGEDDSFYIQSLGNTKGAYITIENRKKEGLVPKMNTLNQFVADFNKKTIFYNFDKEKLYFAPGILLSTNFKIKDSSAPLEVDVFSNKNVKLEIMPISEYGNVVGIGDDAEWGYGSDPIFIKTEASYGYYSSLKKGFSNSWTYYNIDNIKKLENFIGIKINDEIGILNDKRSLRTIADIIAGLPEPVLKSLQNMDNGISFKKTIEGGHVGLGGPNGIEIAESNWNRNRLIETLRHEITHVYDANDPGDGKWLEELKQVGLDPSKHKNKVNGIDKGFISEYSTENWHEDAAEYLGEIYTPETWSDLISEDNEWHKIYRAKLAVLRKYEFMTQGEYEAIFDKAELDSREEAIERYIEESKEFKKSQKLK